MTAQDNKKRYDLEYQAANTRRIVMNVNRKTQPRMLEYLEGKSNISRYIMDLIRADMEKQNIETD